MGEPIDVGNIRVGDTVRVVNSTSNVTFPVREITDMGTGLLMIWNGGKAYGGRPGDGPESYNQFFLVERPSQKDARMLTELKLGKPRIPEELIDYELAPLLGLKKPAKKTGGRKTRRRRSTRRR